MLFFETIAFWNTEHMIIANIAFSQLKEMHPILANFVEEKIKLIKDSKNEDQHPFVESSVWADNIKESYIDALTYYHFEGIPIDSKTLLNISYEKFKFNITWSIGEIKSLLIKKRESYISTDVFESIGWRYLLHLIADLHQPLHATNFFSKDFPTGDYGGHLFNVSYPENKI